MILWPNLLCLFSIFKYLPLPFVDFRAWISSRSGKGTFFIFFFIIFLSFDFFITLNSSLWCSNPILSQWINNKLITNILHIFVFSFNQNHTYLVLSQRVYILLIRLASIERKMTVWPICDYLLVHCNVGKIFHMHFVWFHTKVANLPLQWNLRSNLIQN